VELEKSKVRHDGLQVLGTVYQRCISQCLTPLDCCFSVFRFCGVFQRNSILADEMGLGKTVQSVMFANHLFEKTPVSTKKHLKHVRNVGQFLIVAPLSVIPHWKREFDAWTNMNSVIYHGNAESRTLIEQYV